MSSSSSSSAAAAAASRKRARDEAAGVAPSPVDSLDGRVVFPGDVVLRSPDAVTTADADGGPARKGKGKGKGQEAGKEEKHQVQIRAGAGLVRRGDAVVSSRVGVVSDRMSASGAVRRVTVESDAKRYLAAAEDLVLGTVTERHGEHYTVDVRGSRRATLPSLAFEGATKRNKPNLQVGAVVYARVAVANRDMDPELSCVSPHVKARKDWVTGETVFGELKGGYVFECSLALARDLLDERCYVLRCLGRYLPFELAIGANGRVWINSESPRHTVVVVNCILNSEGMSRSRTKMMVQKLTGAVAE
jgi:exosome complex component RRP40